MHKIVMIVDDEEDLLKVMAMRIRASGYEVVTAKNGQDALDSLHSQAPDIFIVDVQMPVLDGRGLALKLLADERFKDKPILFMSAFTQSLNKIAEELKTEHVFVKPVSTEDLLERMKKLLS